MRQRNPKDVWARVQEDLRILQAQEAEEDPDSEERVACPDESCLGSLGDDGCCRICGRSGSAAYEVSTGVSGDEVGSMELPDTEPDEDEGGLEDRVPCADELCVGAVDEDGYCRICGLKWKEGGYGEGERWVYRGEEGPE